jgi:hypothetical protein
VAGVHLRSKPLWRPVGLVERIGTGTVGGELILVRVEVVHIVAFAGFDVMVDHTKRSRFEQVILIDQRDEIAGC